MDIKMIIKEYYEQFAHKFDNLGEMDQVLEEQNLPKLTLQKIDNLNRHVSIGESESVIS